MSCLPASPVALFAFTIAVAIGGFGIAPAAHAATRTVSNCNDSGAGSLRAAAAAANSGDTIDLRSLTCSQITLTSGAIAIPDQTITIVGAGEDRIRIDGNGASRVFEHIGIWPTAANATLRLQRLTVQNGLISGTNPSGGCIRSLRHVRLEYVHVRNCIARPTNPNIRTSFGGGLAADGNVFLFHAAIYGNRAEQGGVGGGLIAGTDRRLHVDRSVIRDNFSGNQAGGAEASLVFLTHSTIRGNVAGGVGGGLVAGSFLGSHVINKSTISGNRANSYGGIGFFGGNLLISDSTISGNDSNLTPAGLSLEARGAPITVRNSTIADNVALTPFPVGRAAGVQQFGPVNWQSTIIADNYVGATRADLWADVQSPGPIVIGSDNLIETSNAPLPNDTLRVDPRLAPLADNGGRTRTHALLIDSPAIDAGNNNANYSYDQRGEGFPRVVNGRADIGAFERQD